MKKAKENWIGEQCSEIEENLRKNKSKRAYELVKDLTTVEQGKATTVQDRSGKCLAEERQTLNRWTEYCSELYNYKANGDPSVLNCPQTDSEDDHPILCREVEAAVQSLKKGTSQHPNRTGASRWRGCNHRFHNNLQHDLADRRMVTPWTQTSVITLPKTGNLQQCQNYRTISLISLPIKVMLKIVLNGLKPQAEKIIAEEQSGFGAGRSTTEQISKLRILCEKNFQPQKTSTISS